MAEGKDCFGCAYLKMTGLSFVEDACCTEPAVQLIMVLKGERPHLKQQALKDGCPLHLPWKDKADRRDPLYSPQQWKEAWGL